MRREFILAIAAFSPLLLAASGPAPEAPATPRKPVTDVYFDTPVSDDYRWLEDWNDPAVKAWSEAQNLRARAYLDALPSVAEIRKRVHEIATFPSAGYKSLVYRRGTFFALKNQPPKQQPYLVALRDVNDSSSERALVDPNGIDPTGGTAIDFFVPSLDGRLVAVSLSQGGSEAGGLHVYETATGRRLPDEIPRVNGGTAGGDVAWNGDASGFYYTRYPRAGERPAEDLDFYQQVYFHRLGTPSKADTYAIGREFPRIAEITLDSSSDGRFVIAAVKNGDGGDVAQYLRSPTGSWTMLASDADRAMQTRFGDDGSLYLLSRKGAPRGKILRLPPRETELSKAATLVPESEASIEDFCLAETRLYLADVAGGPSRLRAVGKDGKALGTISILPVSAISGLAWAGGDDALFENQSALEPPAWYRVGPEGNVQRSAMVGRSPVDFSDSEVLREWAVSKDGTRVPIDILRRKGLKLDGGNPTLLYGYGGYAISQHPTYQALRRVWLEQGGVFAVAGIRGGGEFGDDWHRAGHLTRKQNVFDDFAACAKRLIELGYARPAKLAIEGGSNGGLLMGAMLTQNPDLFGAIVSHVGIYDMLRVELSPNGAFNVTEFGTVADKEQFRALYAYSPYHHVAPGAAYPPVLMLTGANDPRVDPMQSRKMTALLQASGSSKRTVLLRTSSSSGHGIGSSLDEQTGQSVDVYAFLFDRLGVKYRPM